MYPGPPYLAPDRCTSPAAPGSAVRLAAGIPVPLLRDDAGPRRALAAAMVCAGVGARSQVSVIRHPLPGALVDAAAGYSATSALIQAEHLLTHEIKVGHWQAERSLARLRKLIEQCTLEGLLSKPELWPRLRFVTLIDVTGETFTLRYEPAEGGDPVTMTTAVSGRLGVTGYDLALAYATTGQIPAITEAYLWETGELLPGLRPVSVFDGWTYDPTRTLSGERVYHDFGMLVATYRAHLRAGGDLGLDEATRWRRRAAVKSDGNALVYGKSVQFSIDAGGKRQRYTVDTTWDEISYLGYPEWPGEWCYPPQGAFIVSAARLILGLYLHQVEQPSGSWTNCDTDAGVAHVTIHGGLHPCPGGRHLDDQGRECIKSLSWPEFDRILRSFSALADSIDLPTPEERVVLVRGQARIVTDHPEAARSLFRIEDLNRHPDDPTLIQPGLTVTSYGQKRYTASRLDQDGLLAYDPRGTYSAHGLGHSINLSSLPDRRYHYECHRLVHAWTAGVEVDEPEWLDAPLLTELTIRRPAEYRRYRDLIPDLCAGDVLLVAHCWLGGGELVTRHPGTLTGWDWATAPWVDTTTGRSARIKPYTTISAILQPPSLDDGDEPAAIVHSIRGQLQSIQQGRERGMTTPAGEPCTKTTTGVIIPAPVSIFGRKITGKESHRLAERQTGLTPIAGETQVFAQSKPPLPPAAAGPPRPCQKPGCPELVTGRRLWCPQHAVASSILKRRWRTASVERQEVASDE